MKEKGKEEDAKLLDREPSLICRLSKKTNLRSSSCKQLTIRIGPFDVELQNLIDKREKENEETSPWAENSQQALKRARQALNFCEAQLAWKYFYEAELLSLHLLDKKRLRDCAQATLNEAEEKLSGWRKKSVQDLLGKDSVLNKKCDVNHVYAAREILQDYFCDMYIELGIARFQLMILVPMALALVGLSILVLPNLSGQIAINNASLLFSIALFGAMGGTVSGIISISRGMIKGKIPDQLLNSWLTTIRPLFGAMSALAVSVFLLSGLIQFGDVTYNLTLAISFVAGFSERFLLRAVEL